MEDGRLGAAATHDFAPWPAALRPG
jgi:hypothetical protein